MFNAERGLLVEEMSSRSECGWSNAARLFGAYLISLADQLPSMSEDELFQAILTMQSAIVRHSSATPLDVPRMRFIRNIIDRNLGSWSLNAGRLCKLAAITRSTLYRMFEPYGGVVCYIQRQRLRRVYGLLTDPTCTLKIHLIADKYCFSDSSALSSRLSSGVWIFADGFKKACWGRPLYSGVRRGDHSSGPVGSGAGSQRTCSGLRWSGGWHHPQHQPSGALRFVHQRVPPAAGAPAAGRRTDTSPTCWQLLEAGCGRAGPSSEASGTDRFAIWRCRRLAPYTCGTFVTDQLSNFAVGSEGELPSLLLRQCIVPVVHRPRELLRTNQLGAHVPSGLCVIFLHPPEGMGG